LFSSLLLLALALSVDMNLVLVGVNQLLSTVVAVVCVMHKWAVVTRTLGSVGYVFASQGIWRGYMQVRLGSNAASLSA